MKEGLLGSFLQSVDFDFAVPRWNLMHRVGCKQQHRRKLDDLAPTARPIEDVAGVRESGIICSRNS
jgi:hypothetical protein